MSQCNGANPIKIHTAIDPFLLIPAHTWTLTGCFWARLLSYFPVAYTFVSFHLYSCLIAPYDIIKIVM